MTTAVCTIYAPVQDGLFVQGLFVKSVFIGLSVIGRILYRDEYVRRRFVIFGPWEESPCT